MASPLPEYFSIAGAPGQFFRCDAYRATLSVKACAGRFKAAQSARGDQLDGCVLCRGCPIGSTHAGQPVSRFSPLYGQSICNRCQSGSMRLIGDEICVSDYNRQREFLSGRNSKGTRPVKARQLDRRIIRISIEGGPVRLVDKPLSTDNLEVMVGVLRKVPGRTMFGFHSQSPAIRQGRLF